MDVAIKDFTISRLALRRLGTFPGEDKVLAEVGNRVLKLSESTYQVLEGITLGLSCEQIAERINDRHLLTSPATAAVVKTIKLHLQTLLHTKLGFSERATNLWARITVLRLTQMRPMLVVLGALIMNPLAFYATFLAAIIGNGVWMAMTPVPGFIGHSALLMPIVIMGMAILSLAHELSHAAAALRFKIAPESIGLGLYVCVPVFYTDITGIWCLPPRQRIIVNLAGVYVQLLLNLPLQWLATQVASPQARWVIVTVGWMNVGAAIINLMPFVKLDGYWVVADWIGSTHLQRDANALIKRMARFAVGRAWEGRRPSLSLLIYATGQMLVYGLALKLMAMAVIQVAATIYHAHSVIDAAWQLVSGSFLQAALCAFLAIKLLTKLVSLKTGKIGKING